MVLSSCSHGPDFLNPPQATYRPPLRHFFLTSSPAHCGLNLTQAAEIAGLPTLALMVLRERTSATSFLASHPLALAQIFQEVANHGRPADMIAMSFFSSFTVALDSPQAHLDAG